MKDYGGLLVIPVIVGLGILIHARQDVNVDNLIKEASYARLGHGDIQEVKYKLLHEIRHEERVLGKKSDIREKRLREALEKLNG